MGIGIDHMISRRIFTPKKARGFMLTFTGKKAMKGMPDIGTHELVNPSAKKRYPRNGMS
jgi:hypothetical protein